ncbi:MAG TPA: site-2 protease family protein [Caulobacteraceae bacterium]|nr:site-2 protease family protein [Caulobacteraceae bacterium]
MTDTPRTPGPWDQVATAPARPAAAQPAARPAVVAGGMTGKEIGWAVLSSGLVLAWLWWMMGPAAAIAGLFGILVHELGHLWAINRLGCGPGKIHFIPFLGGAASAARPSPTEWIDVIIALAGPAVGILATLPFFAGFLISGETFWLEGAFFISVINLLNLAPAPPLDGSKAIGPVLARIHPTVERVALLAVGLLAVAWAVNRGSWILAIFVGLSVIGAMRSGAMRPNASPLTSRQTAMSVGAYLGVTAVCFAALYASITLGGGSAVKAFDSLLGF